MSIMFLDDNFLVFFTNKVLTFNNKIFIILFQRNLHTETTMNIAGRHPRTLN